MHLCLSCNQPCSLSSVFCDACRVSLLERRAEKEQAVGVGGREALAEEGSLSQKETGHLSSSLEIMGREALQQTEEEKRWSWEATGFSTVEALAGRDSTVPAEATLARTSRTFAWRRMPKRVRRALLAFLLVGALALAVDGVLLALSLIQHHTLLPTASQAGKNSALKPLALTPTVPPDATTIVLGNAFALSPASLTFTATQGQTDFASQSVTLFSGGPSSFSWQVVSTPPSWLNLSSKQGRVMAGARAQLTINVQAAQLAPDTYTAHLQVKAVDEQGNLLPKGLQPLMVVLSVLPSCSLVLPCFSQFRRLRRSLWTQTALVRGGSTGKLVPVRLG